MGSQEPSERIVPRATRSDGTDAIKILRLGGLILDPWQSEIISDWLGFDKSDKWASKTCGGSVPRQNGKTGLIQARAAVGMIMYNEQVIYTAHLQKTATETFEELRDFFENPKLKKYVKDIKTALGREQIILKSGARIKFLARTRNGGRGQHGDLLIFDEAQELDSSAQASFIPAISASLNPQTIYVGTPPETVDQGLPFKEIRQKALAGETKATAWFEFSVSEIGDIHDKQRWADTNPALGRRILLSTIEGEIEQLDADCFARERLGWWTPEVKERIENAIDLEKWTNCMSELPKPEGKTAFGVKFSLDGSMVTLAGAVIDTEGRARISLIEHRDTSQGIQWLANWLNARYKTTCCVVIDGKNGVDLLIDKLKDTWKAKGSIVRAGAKDVVASASLLINEVNEETLTWYYKQTTLDESVQSATKRTIYGGFGFGGEFSTPIEACSLALYGVKTTKRDPSKKMRIG